LREGERLESGEAKGSVTVVAGVGARERVWEEAWAVGRRVGLADAVGSTIVAGSVGRQVQEDEQFELWTGWVALSYWWFRVLIYGLA
jgi:hypothetical protein